MPTALTFVLLDILVRFWNRPSAYPRHRGICDWSNSWIVAKLIFIYVGDNNRLHESHQPCTLRMRMQTRMRVRRGCAEPSSEGRRHDDPATCECWGKQGGRFAMTKKKCVLQKFETRSWTKVACTLSGRGHQGNNWISFFLIFKWLNCKISNDSTETERRRCLGLDTIPFIRPNESTS